MGRRVRLIAQAPRVPSAAATTEDVGGHEDLEARTTGERSSSGQSTSRGHQGKTRRRARREGRLRIRAGSTDMSQRNAPPPQPDVTDAARADDASWSDRGLFAPRLPRPRPYGWGLFFILAFVTLLGVNRCQRSDSWRSRCSSPRRPHRLACAHDAPPRQPRSWGRLAARQRLRGRSERRAPTRRGCPAARPSALDRADRVRHRGDLRPIPNSAQRDQAALVIRRPDRLRSSAPAGLDIRAPVRRRRSS